MAPEHADDVEPAVLQSIQREGVVRPRGRWVSTSVAIKGARLAAPGVKHGPVEHQAHLVRTVHDELAPRPRRCAASLIAVLLRCFRAPPRCCLAMARKGR